MILICIGRLAISELIAIQIPCMRSRNPLSMFHIFGNLISLIKKSFSQDWIVDLCYTLRESNSAADCLVKLGAKSSEKLVFLDTTPSYLSSMLLVDALDISFVRY
ncbi:hypothetical protein MtrunA17_Chr7g0237781 [Medicago truncatula]|uniref:RNase H type-1 domain-containing protein n=1 Tax=Medicago truncatula TaxID=3880 RepID=A0A072TZH7_MEDTR|nr:hypothetical protein MTR_7g059175 [Medicago truncatula]RHN46025.1 hypothetical protein MtrunA17_Chr7g0237781 [Medicago truncatula]